MKKTIIPLLIALLFISIARAAPYNFTLTSIEVGPYGPYSHLDYGDIDGDGDLDVIIYTIAGDIYWYSQLGLNTEIFSGQNYVSTVSSAVYGKSWISLDDLDADGDLDISVNEGYGLSNTVKIYRWRNNGNGASWTQMSTIDSGIYDDDGNGGRGLTSETHKTVEIAKLNADNYPDYIISTHRYLSPASDTKIIYGAAAFATGTVVSRTRGQLYTGNSLEVADVDNDGDLDILYAGGQALTYPETRWIEYYTNLGGTSWSASPTVVYSGTQSTPEFLSSISDLLVVDWNEDGRNDILSNYVWFERLANGSYERHDQDISGDTSIRFPAPADFNNDDIVDVSFILAIREGTGVNETLGTKTDLAAQLGLGSVYGFYQTNVDFNNDSDIDILYARLITNGVYYLQNNEYVPPLPPNDLPVLHSVEINVTPNYVNYPIYLTGNGTDNESNVLYSGVDCNYPSSLPTMTMGVTQICTYPSVGNYTARYYLTDDLHQTNYSVFQDVNLEAIPNSLPVIDNVHVQNYAPLVNRQISVDATGTDPEGNNLLYGINCDYTLGDPMPSYNNLSTKYCIYGTPGFYTIRYYLTDDQHPTDYSVYQDEVVEATTHSTDRWGQLFLLDDVPSLSSYQGPFVYDQINEIVYNSLEQPFYVYDISSPASISTLSTNPSSFPRGVLVAKNGNYLIRPRTLSPYGLEVWDGTNLNSISLVLLNESLSWRSSSNSLGAVYGDYVYVSTNAGLRVVDTSVFPTLSITATLPATTEIKIYGNYLYTASGQIYSLSNPASPTLVSTAASGANIVVLGDYLFILASPATPSCTLYAYDISNKSSPTLVSSWLANEGHDDNYCRSGLTGTITDGKYYLFHTSYGYPHGTNPDVISYMFVTEVTDPFNHYLQTVQEFVHRDGYDPVRIVSYNLDSNGDDLLIANAFYEDKLYTISDAPINNELPFIYNITPTATYPAIGETSYLSVSSTDYESNTMYYAVNCDYSSGDPMPTFDTNNVKQCSYSTRGAYDVRIYVTDSAHPNDYSNWQQLRMNVIGTPDFFESFGTTTWTSGTIDNGYSRVRTASWLSTKTSFSGGNWDNVWKRWGIDNSGSWDLRPETDARINTPRGYSMYQYNSPWNTNAYHGISYVFNEPFTFRDNDYIDFYCAYPTERQTGNIGRVETNMIFKQEDGTGGFCLQFVWLTTCSFSDNDAWMGCNPAENTVCVSIPEYCGGWDGYVYYNDPQRVTLKVSDYVDEAHRSNLQIVELANRATGGGWSEPRTYGALFDDFSLAYSPVTLCGNLVCDAGENYQNCPSDCVSYCGDGLCNPSTESSLNCVPDCGAYSSPGSGPGTSQPKEEEQVPQYCTPGTQTVYREEFITKYEDVPISNLVREKVSELTCGIDANQDGLSCDPNEDFISCSEDCKLNIADVLCLGDKCIFTEAWFLKIFLILMTMMALYLVYTLYLT